MKWITLSSDNKVSNVYGSFYSMSEGERTNAIPVPDQALALLIPGDGTTAIYYPDGWQTYTPEEIAAIQCEVSDEATGKSISEQIHQFCGTDESIGILRDQIVHILNGDIVATPDFKRLNEIAIAAVEDGAAKKADL